jgi:hypothetical protein
MTVGPNQTLRIDGKIRIADDYSDSPPCLEIVDPAADSLIDAKNTTLASNAILVTDGSLTDWQDVTVSYTNTELLAKRVFVRCSAQRANGEVYEVWSTSLE